MVLHYHRGNRTLTAETLGISIRTLRYKIDEYLRLGYPVPTNHTSVSLKDFQRKKKYLDRVY
jgi:outer membrane protein assembly factor BamA